MTVLLTRVNMEEPVRMVSTATCVLVELVTREISVRQVSKKTIPPDCTHYYFDIWA